MKFSALNFYSEGLVGANRDGTHFIEVFPLGVLGAKDGDVSASVGRIQEEGTDGQGKRYQVTLEFTDTIPARWLPMDTNRITPPDVRVGELVRLYRVADTDQFFWRTLGMDNNLRRLETVIYAFSATEGDVEELTPENSYFFEISTHSKQITLSTCKANREPFAYLLQIDTEEGIITIEDDVGNTIIFNSRDTLIHLENKDGSLLKLDKRNGLMVLPDTYEIKCTDYKLTASKSITTETEVRNDTASKSYDIKTIAYTCNADSTAKVTSNKIDLTASIINFNGNTKTSGTAAISGAVTMGAGGAAKGTISAAKLESKGLITSMGKNVGGTHTHSSGGGGVPN